MDRTPSSGSSADPFTSAERADRGRSCGGKNQRWFASDRRARIDPVRLEDQGDSWEEKRCTALSRQPVELACKSTS